MAPRHLETKPGEKCGLRLKAVWVGGRRQNRGIVGGCASVSLRRDPYLRWGRRLVRPEEALYDGCHAAIVDQGVGIRVVVCAGVGLYCGRRGPLPGGGHYPAGVTAIHRTGPRRSRGSWCGVGGDGARYPWGAARLHPRNHQCYHHQSGSGGGLRDPRWCPRRVRRFFHFTVSRRRRDVSGHQHRCCSPGGGAGREPPRGCAGQGHQGRLGHDQVPCRAARPKRRSRDRSRGGELVVHR